jgi:hypothetical protein
MLRWSSWNAVRALCLVCVLLWTGCGRTEAPSTPKSSASQGDRGAAVLAAVAKADAADGTVDKVVSKCVTCMLGMEGKPEFAAAWGEYTVHLCSAECKETFTKDPEKALLALKFPEEKKIEGPDTQPRNP